MDKLQLPHAKLLYFVSELWKSNEIQNNEKLQLKEMIISDEPKVFKILDNYEATQNMYQLKNDIINLVRQPAVQSQNTQQHQNSVDQVKSQMQQNAQPKQQQQIDTQVVDKQQSPPQQQPQPVSSQPLQQQPPVIHVEQENINGVEQEEMENTDNVDDIEHVLENYADIQNQAQINDPSSPLGNYLQNIKKAKPTGIKAIKDVLRPIKNSQQ